MATVRPLYLKGCASLVMAVNTLRKRELQGEGSLVGINKCPFPGRLVSRTPIRRAVDRGPLRREHQDSGIRPE